MGFIMRSIKIQGLSVLFNHIFEYPTPIVGYISSFGSLAGVCLVIQIITGLFLAIHYSSHISIAFISVEHIIRDVNDGWLFRYYHSNGASIFFFCMYAHIYVNISSEAEDIVWLSGVLLYVLAIATAFIGYTLPWGQISYWGATVITNLFAAIPVIGTAIAQWLWGGFSIENPTLNRFFALHFFLPFVIVAVVILHLSLLHVDESTTDDDEQINFFYFYFIKDLCAFTILMLVFGILVFFHPNLLSHPDNYIPANITVTPRHLVPEWYFLPFYAILRAVPDKFGGLVLMGFFFVDFFLLDLISSDNNTCMLANNLSVEVNEQADGVIENEFDIGTVILLFYLGGADIEEPYTDIISVLMLLHFYEFTEIEEELYELRAFIFLQFNTNYYYNYSRKYWFAVTVIIVSTIILVNQYFGGYFSISFADDLDS
jgi:ubiquinol-cytochrome c reductase cytochrome b subunit